MVRQLYKLSYTRTTPSLGTPILQPVISSIVNNLNIFHVSMHAVQIFQRGSKYFEIFGLGGSVYFGGPNIL